MEVVTEQMTECTPMSVAASTATPVAPSGAIRASPQQQSEEDALSEEFSKLNHIYQTHLDSLIQQGVMLFSSATQRCNYHKNRYSNVLAMEPTRVKLQRYHDCFLDTDYINANYINGEIPGSERAYISCQAPLPSTLLPFWLMVWEQNCPVIVMLTRLTEREKPKAIVYWPENVGDTREFGNIAVTLKKTKSVDQYLEMRTLEIVCDGVRRQIVQFHYMEWPDFGVPSSTATIRELICLMDLYRMKGMMNGVTGPVITHCSAGVGRTGTFLAVHICMEKMKYYNSLDHINIPRTVMLLRQARNGMVQTQEQYQFIYEVVKDARADLRERAQRVFAAPSLATLAATTSPSTTTTTATTTTPTTTTTTTTTSTPLQQSAPPNTTNSTNSYQHHLNSLHNLLHNTHSTNHHNHVHPLHNSTDASYSSNISFSKRCHKRNHPDTPTLIPIFTTGATTGATSSATITSITSVSSPSHGRRSSAGNTTTMASSSTTTDEEKGSDREVLFCLEKKRRLSFSTC